MSDFLALGFNSGTYQAEYLRGSILAIGDGPMMAKAKVIAAQTYDPIGSYLAVVYLAIVYLLDAVLL